MATAHQLAQYCLDHGYVLQPKGKEMTQVNSVLGMVPWFTVGMVALAYMVGRMGLPQFITDLKNIWSWIRSKV